MTTISMLHDTHVLILMGDKKTRNLLTRLFEVMGAKVHTAQTQNEAIGLYWRLFRAGIRPRVVVTSWSLHPHDSQEYKYLEMIGRAEVDGTALNLLVNIVDLDPTAYLTVYTQDPIQAKEILEKSSIEASVFSRIELEPVEFVVRIATSPGISAQRVDSEELSLEMRSQEERRQPRSSAEIPALPRMHLG
jgi:hypothetical protein